MIKNCSSRKRIVKIALVAIILFLALWYFKNDKNQVLNTANNFENTEQYNEFNQKIHAYIMNHPEVIAKSLENMHKRQINEMKSKLETMIRGRRNEIETSPYSPYLGKDNADITIVQFLDYSCQYCKKSGKVLNDILASNNNIKVILRIFPIFGEASEYSAKIVLAVNQLYPNKFESFHNRVLGLGIVNKENMQKVASDLGIEYSKLEDNMDMPEVRKELRTTQKLAHEIGISGAPAFIVNGEYYPGYLTLEQMKEIVEKAKSDL